jgi:bla regulator protein blaR1
MAELFAYLLKSGACLALLYSFYRLVLMKDTNFAFNRAFLLGSAALSLVLPLLRVPSPFFTTVIDPAALAPGEAFATAAPPGGPGWLEVLFIVYLAVAGLLFALFLVRVVRLGLMAARCGCERHSGLRVVLCGHPGESFSFFHFVFLNKSKVPGGDVDRVLAHELAHVRQLHSVDIVFTEILAVIQWFNPFVWPYKRSLRETHEYLADRAVIAQGCSLARYQLLIVEQHVGGRLLELASSFRTSQIKRRINMLSKQETKGLARWKPLLILPLAVGFVLAFAESRTILQPGPAAVVAPLTAASPSQELSDEEMAKALKEKLAKLEEMKKAQSEKMADLKAKLEETTDPDAKAKIMALMKEGKLKSLEFGAKERGLKAKALELAMAKENDADKKAEMAKKLEVLKAEGEEYQKKLAEVSKAEEKAQLEKKAKEEKAKHTEKK